MNTKELLLRIIDESNKSELLNTVFNIDGKAYVTNGHMLLIAEFSDEPFGEVATEKTKTRFSTVSEMNKSELTAVDFPAIGELDKCVRCEGHGFLTGYECDACDGDGWFYHHDEDYDCKKCDSKGVIESKDDEAKKIKCEECDGLGNSKLQGIDIGNQRFATHYLARIADLPNLKFFTNLNKNKMAYFTFDGGEGFLMPFLK